MSHDAELVAKVAEAIRCRTGDPEDDARAVLDALDVPGLIRAAKAEALREAANSWQVNEWADVLIPGVTKNPLDNAQRVVDWLRARAAEIDPEEGDHE